MTDVRPSQSNDLKNAPPIPSGGDFSLDDKQKKIWEGLVKKNKSLADVYLGSLKLLKDNANPARYFLAAHGFRALGWQFRGQQIAVAEGATQDSFKEIIKKQIAKSDPLGGAPDYLIEEISSKWNTDLQRWFNKIAKNPDIEVTDKEFEKKLADLEDILSSVLVPHFDVINEVDQILLIEKPAKEDVLHLKNLLARGRAVYEYFFNKAQENWLEVLTGEKFFSSPPTQTYWPESGYLVKITEKKPKKVLALITKLPKTDNYFIHRDFIKAGVSMPAKLAVKLVSVIRKQQWLNNTYDVLVPHSAADLMAKLIEENETKAALEIASMLTDVRVDQPKKYKNKKDKPIFIRPEAKPIWNDQWQYHQIIEEKMAGFKVKAPEGFLKILCDRLEKALELEDRGGKNADDFYEYSYIWRPDIAHSRFPHHEDVKNALLGAIVDLANFVGENNPDNLKRVGKIIKGYKHPIFRRIELYLYRTYPNPFTFQIKKLLTDERAIRAHNMQGEYLPLLKDQFLNLDINSQNKILKVIEAGFGMKRSRDYPIANFKRMVANAQMVYLQPILDKLSPVWKKMYDDLFERYGQPHVEDREMKTWTGPTSPVTTGDLQKKSTPEVIDYLIAWMPPKDSFMTPSAEGLGRLFQEVVTQRCDEFSRVARTFFDRNIRPVYIYHLFYGLKEALKKDQYFEWQPVIDLALAIVNTKDYSKFPKTEDKFEPDWRSVRKSIVDLLRDGFGLGEHAIPFSLREEVWKLLEVISDDPDPTLDYEKKYGGDNMDPASLSVNTVRGEAMHAVMNYGLWCARNLYPNKEDAEKTESKLVPEMEKVIDKHLDPSIDPTLTIRSVYGWYLPNLFYLNKKWVIKNLDRIFPKEEAQRELWVVAWETYLSNNVYNDLFAALKDEYRRSIPLLSDPINKKGHKYVDLHERLPQHFMVAFVYDFAHDDLINEFFEVAPAQARGQAISFIGRAILKESEVNLDKVKALWERRLALPRERQDAEEFSEFGWWLSRSSFERKWNIDSLLATLEITGGDIEPRHEIPGELRKYAEEFPLQTIKSLNLIVRGDKDGWRIQFDTDHHRSILQIALQSENKEATEVATDLIHYLGQRGYNEYRDLLN